MYPKIHVVLFLVLVFPSIYLHQKHFASPTPVSRLDLLHSLTIHQTFNIDLYHTNTPDKAAFQGHFFSDKAPGTVVIAAPAFFLSLLFLRLVSVSPEGELGWLLSSWMACTGSIAIVSALGGVSMFVYLCRWVVPRYAVLTVVALFLGGAPLPYSTMMFSHALVIGLLAIAIWAITLDNDDSSVRALAMRSAHLVSAEGDVVSQKRNASDGNQKPVVTIARVFLTRNRSGLIAGFASGWALASEFTSGVVVLGLAFLIISDKPRQTFPFCLAMTLPLLLIPAYSLICLGNPFTLPYSYQASFPEMSEGLYAIKWPDPLTALNLLFSPSRGLLFWSPFLMMAGMGYLDVLRKSKTLFWLTYGIPVLQLLIISGRVWDWPAGAAFGARYLAPVLPLLAIPVAIGLMHRPVLGMLLGLYSITITTIATLTDACPTFGSHPNPLLDLQIPLFINGDLSPNLGIAAGLSPHLSVIVFYAILGSGIVSLWRMTAAAKRQLNRHNGK